MSQFSQPDSDEPPVDEGLIKVDYIKSQFFRIVHVDGAIGGMSPNGDLHIDLWNVREAIPRRVTLKTGDGGEIEVMNVETRCDFVHEVEVGLVMSVSTAKSLRDWLTEQIGESEGSEDLP